MTYGWWGGKPQVMNYFLGLLKGMRVILEERGVNTRGMNTDKMQADLDSHPDFMNEISLTTIERYLVEEKYHIIYMLPKFHCELNPIERMWVQSSTPRGTVSTAS